MTIKNYEFKAQVNSLDEYEKKLLLLNPEYKGLDHQIDTYFNTNKGRLKLREGNIENALINYDRQDKLGSKESTILLYQHAPNPALKNILAHQLGIKVVVDKKRKIYFIDNVKFHFDTIDGLGTFIEVEAIDATDSFTIEELKKQCDHYYEYLGINDNQTIKVSYSDLLLIASNGSYF